MTASPVVDAPAEPAVDAPVEAPVDAESPATDSATESTESPVVGAVPEPDPELGEGYPTRDNSEVDPSAGSPEPSPESGEPGTSGT